MIKPSSKAINEFRDFANSLLQDVTGNNRNLLRAIFYCSIPRWFNREVIVGICPPEIFPALSIEEVLQKIQSLPFCELHSSRKLAWILFPGFRSYLNQHQEVTDHWQELHERAAATFKQMLDAKGLQGSEKFQDPDWREIATEWVYHLLYLDPEIGLKTVRRICAQALAQPVYGPMWEVDFCLQFLNGLEWPSEATQLDEPIYQLKEGFRALAAYQDVKSLKMAKGLVDVPELTSQEKAELHYWIGTVHLYQEYRYAPALEELEKALRELEKAKQDNPDQTKLREIRIKEANIYAVITDVYLSDLLYARYDLAQKYAQKAKELAPDKAVGYVALGKIYAQQEDWDQAEEYYQQAKKIERDATDAYLGLSEVFDARRDIESVVKILDQVTKNDPSYYYYVLIRKGDAYFSARQFEEAEKLYQQAKKEAPERIEAYIALGNLYSTLGSIYWTVGQSGKAEKFYQKVIDIAPNLPDGYVALATIYENREKWQRAIEICNEALNKDVNNKKQLYFPLIRIYSQLSRFEDLKKIQKKIVSDDPMEEYAAHCAEGATYLEKAWNLRDQLQQDQLLTDAEYKFDQALEIDEHDQSQRIWAYLSLTEIAVLRKDEAEVERLEKQVREKMPWARYDFLISLGQAYQRNFQGDKSEEVLQQAKKVAPHRVAAWRALSELYSWQGNLAGLEQVWSELVCIDKTLKYEGYITIGNAYHKVANVKKARQEYTKARDLEHQTAESYLYLAMLDKDESNWNDAVTNYVKVAEIASDFASFVYAQIAEIYLDQGKIYLDQKEFDLAQEHYESAEEFAKRAILFDAEQVDGYVPLAYLGLTHDNQTLVQKVKDRLNSIAPDKLCDFDCALGDYLFRRGEYKKAEQAYRDCISIKCSPQKADPYVHLGVTLLEQKQYAEASKHLTKALELDTTSAEVYIALGRFHLVQGSLQKGSRYWDKAVKREPTEKYNACVQIGDAYATNFRNNKTPTKPSRFKTIIQNLSSTLFKVNAQINQDFYLATQQYRTAIDLCPWRLEAYINLAPLLVEQDQLEAANKIYRQAREATGYSYSDLGWYYVQQEQFDEAFRVYHFGIQEEPEQLDPYTYLTYLLVIQGRINQAFQECHKIPPELRYDAYLSLGDILSDPQGLDLAEESYAQRLDLAEESYRQGIKFTPERPEAYIRVAQLLVNKGDLDEAFRICDKMLQQPELEYNAHVLRGSLLVIQGSESYGEGEQAYQQAINIDPNQLDAYYQLAALYEQQQRIDEAIQRYDTAIYLQSDNENRASLYQSVGNLWIQKEDYPQAVEALQQASQLQPDNQEIKMSLAEAYLSWGKDYQRRGDLNQALEKYTQATETYSKYTEAYIARATLYECQGDDESLERMAQQILELDPADEYDASLVVANAYQAVGNSEKEEECYRQLIDNYPKQPKAWMLLAPLLAEQQQLEESIQCYQTAADLLFEDTEVSDAYTNIGNLYIQQERYSEALEAFQKAVQHNPFNAEVYFSIGAISESLNNLNQAVEMYTKTIETEPKYAEAYLALGRIFKQKGKDEELEQLIQRILSLDPEDKYGAYLVSAAIYQETEKNEQAEATYHRAIQEHPKFPDAYTNLIELLVKQDQFERAIEVCQDMAKQPDLAYNATIIHGNVLRIQENYHDAPKVYESAIEQDAERSEAYLQLAYLYQQQNQLGKAEQYLEQGLAIIPYNPDLYSMQAELDEQQKQWDKAISHYRKAAEYQSDSSAKSTAYGRIGNLLIQQGDFHHAIDALQQARIYNPSNAEAHFLLGIAYENLEQWDEVVKMYTRTIQIDPAYFVAYTNLCRLYGQKGDLLGIDRMADQIKNQSEKLPLEPTAKAQAHLIIAQAYIEVQLYEWAIKEIEEAINIDPNLPDAYSLKGYIYEIKQKWAKARAEYAQLANLAPDSQGYVALRIGQLFLRENNLEEAEKAFSQVTNLAPEKLDITPSANLFLADIYRKQGRNQDLQNVCANVISLVSTAESPDSNALRQQGLAHFMQGDYVEAEQALNKALQSNPQNAQARFYLALTLLCLGHYDRSQTELQQGIDLAPDKSYYQYAIEEAELLAAQMPEVSEAQEMLQTLIEARDKAA